MANYANFNKFLAAKSYKTMLDIVDRDARAKEPRTVGDWMLLEILKRLHVMRGIAARAARLRLSDEERRVCQREIDALKEEIEGFARSVPPAASPEDVMQPLDDSIARVSGLIDDWAERASPPGEEPERDAPRPAEATPEDEEEKLTRWMESLMGSWGMDPDEEE